MARRRRPLTERHHRLAASVLPRAGLVPLPSGQPGASAPLQQPGVRCSIYPGLGKVPSRRGPIWVYATP